MNKERLLDVADMIENDRLPNVVFNMWTWAKHNRDIDPECGTSIGLHCWICSVRRLRQQESQAHGNVL